MKRLLIIAAAALPALLFAQEKEGRIVYQETVKFEIQLPEGQEAMASMLPPSQSFTRILHFTGSESLYKTPDTEPEGGEAEWTGSEGGATVKVVIRQPESQLYKDLKEKKKVELRELMGKRFIIRDETDTFHWKLTGEQQTVVGYTCFKAVHQDTARTVVAWFTPQIPVSTGPDSFGQLPGLILSVDVDNGKRTITATEVFAGESQDGKLTPPSKGKVVTQEEFDRIEAEKMKEMEQEGGEGQMIIRIRD